MIVAAIVGGLFIGVLSALPVVSLGNCCCLWLVGGGFLSAYIASHDEPRALPVGRGAAVGCAAGLLGAFVWLVSSIAIDVVLAPIQARVLDELLQGARDIPPNVKVFLESMSEEGGTSFKYVLGFFLLLFLGAPMATLGGVMGAAYFRKDVPPALGGTVAPPPLP